jgi:hypothetical protein
MAKIKSGILGPVSGRIGGVVGAKWKDVPVLRSYPISVANPNTSAQQNQRGKFGQCVSVARFLLADLIHVYWDPFSRTMSGFNHFIQVNIDAFGPESLISPENFYSARGVLSGLKDADLSTNLASHSLLITWSDNSGEGDALGLDCLAVCWYNITQGYWSFKLTTAVRQDEECSIIDPYLASGNVLHVYPFLSREDISRISDSVYLTTTVS